MRIRLYTAAALGLIAGVACAPDAEEREVSAGQALYEANCRDCHGERALGDGPMAASLPAQPASLIEHLGHHTKAQLIQLIRSGVPPAMPPAALTDEQVQQVVDYVWTLVPEDQVAALREMQEHMEMMGGMPMPGMPGMGDSASATPAGGMDHMDH